MAISIIVVYFVLIFGVVALQRRVSSYDDFLVGRKNTGTWVTALSVRAAGESGWLVLGLTGLGYVIGIHGIWVVVGETLFESLSWLWLARRFKRDTEKHNVTSVVDYIEVKSGDSVGIVRFVASMIIILMFVTYLAAQVSAFGKAFYSFLGIRPILGMIVGMALVFLYCSIGGYRAVAKISSIHGLVMIFGIMAMPILCFLVLNDRGLSLTKISAPAPYFWNIWGEHGFSTAGIISALSYFAIGLAFLGAPHLYTKFLASKSPYVIARGTPIAIAFTAIGDSCALLTGVLGRYIFPHLADGEYVVPLLSKSIFAPVMIGVFAVVAMAAIMSTADALLHQVATSGMHDVYHRMFHEDASQKLLLRYSRVLMVIVAIFAIIAAYGDLRLVFWMVLFSWAGVGCAFSPLMIVFGLRIKVTKYGVLSGLIGGCCAAVFWNMFYAKRTGLYEMIPGFIVALILIPLVSRAERLLVKQ